VFLSVVARPRPGVAQAAARAELLTIASALASENAVFGGGRAARDGTSGGTPSYN